MNKLSKYLARLALGVRRNLPLVLVLLVVASFCAAPCFGQNILVNTANGGSATAVLIAKALAVLLIIGFAIFTAFSIMGGHTGQALVGFAGIAFCIVLMLSAQSAVTMFTNWANSGSA